MAAQGVLRTLAGGQVGFWCPGCETMHVVRIEGNGAWAFNGDFDRPTFHPSVLARSGHFIRDDTAGNCWCDFELRYPGRGKSDFKCSRCHSFVADGQIQFLSDCSHALAGQTVPLRSAD